MAHVCCNFPSTGARARAPDRLPGRPLSRRASTCAWPRPPACPPPPPRGPRAWGPRPGPGARTAPRTRPRTRPPTGPRTGGTQLDRCAAGWCSPLEPQAGIQCVAARPCDRRGSHARDPAAGLRPPPGEGWHAGPRHLLQREHLPRDPACHEGHPLFLRREGVYKNIGAFRAMLKIFWGILRYVGFSSGCVSCGRFLGRRWKYGCACDDLASRLHLTQ